MLLASLEAKPDLTLSVIHGLGWLYLVLFLMNLVWTVRSFRHDGEVESLFGMSHVPKAAFWGLYTTFLMLVSVVHLTAASGDSFWLTLPQSV